ncbi:unnamed protein product [Amoebophrya sp. A25]|nr:unnamed protein product [Amoebophrya sp. A25]|eukprot:GSA25T00007192001.1
MASKAVQFEVTNSAQKLSPQKKPWTLNPDRYQIADVIGTGSYGKVFGAVDKFTGKRVAIKRSKDVFGELTDCKRMLREIAILNRVEHRNVVKLHEIYLLSGSASNFTEIALVLEQCQFDMKKLFKSNETLNEAHSRALFYRICCGVQYLHSRGVWHRDLKPANILLNEDCTVKICDFGLARAVATPDGNASLQLLEDKNSKNQSRDLTAHVVTRWYRAPELILLHDFYTEAIDVWSLGCILFELALMEPRYCPKEDIPKKRVPLFPGACCYPLSPRKDKNDNPVEVYLLFYRSCTSLLAPNTSEKIIRKTPLEGSPCILSTFFHLKKVDKKHVDQLRVIFEHVGTPRPSDYDFLSNPDAKYYLRKHFPVEKARPPTWFHQRLHNVDPLLDDALRRLLVFNPAKRTTLRACMEHDFLKKTRTEERQRGYVDHDVEMSGTVEPIALHFPDHRDMTESELRHFFVMEEKLSKQRDLEYRRTRSVNMC